MAWTMETESFAFESVDLCHLIRHLCFVKTKMHVICHHDLHT